jgi:4-carboxymuconolactone decarboxylase
MRQRMESEQVLMDLAGTAGPVLQTLAKMHVENRERSGLDDRSYALVRFAALVAAGAAPMSYLTTLAMGDEAGVTVDEIQGVLVAIAPVVGSVRVMAALASTDDAMRISRAR